MDTGTLLSFLALDLLLVCVPGADWAYVIATGLRGRPVGWAVGGLVGGYALHTALAAAGLAVLVAGSPGTLTALTAAGAGYLVWLGWGVLRRPGVRGGAEAPGRAAGQAAGPPEAGREAVGATGGVRAAGGSQGAAGWAGVFRRGAAISGLNPKGLLLYLSVLPQFLTVGAAGAGSGAGAGSAPGPGSGSVGLPVPVQTAVLGLLHMACCAAVYGAVGVASRRLLGARPRAARAVTRTSGAAMLGIGAFLLVQRLAAVG
ncbi:LysE family translocator [Streptomyces sp. NPDC091281]|uniref:LysE family translocator n=1 Tax=Streptomyces sp. NPDC091281 TaxID=3365985 RepID=UPI00381DA918